MTHDELLERLNAYPNSDTCWKLAAIRAVVELHKSEGTPEQQCKHDKKIWPCLTIQIIEKGLV